MKQITLEELLEAGCHFGHQITRQNAKAREFIFEERDGIHIIDLGKTKEGLIDAAEFALITAQKPDSTLLIVGTKRQAAPLLEELLTQAMSQVDEKLLENVKKSIFTVTKRWMGGTLTNSAEMSKNYERLKEIREKLTTEEWKQKYTKKELGLFEKEKQKLESFYGGIIEMKHMPSVIFVIDTHTEDLSVREARRMGVPVIGIVDTNADPDLVDYVIPANDDAVGSLKLLISYVLGAWIEGKNVQATASKKEETSSVISSESEKSPEKPAKKTPKKETSVAKATDVKRKG